MWQKELYFKDDPVVCTKLSLVSWGERHPSFEVGNHSGDEHDYAPDLNALKAHLRYIVGEWNKKWVTYPEDSMMAKRVHRMAYIEAVTSSLQPMARKHNGK